MILKTCFLIIWMQLIKRRVNEMIEKRTKKKMRGRATRMKIASKPSTHWINVRGASGLRSSRPDFAEVSLQDMIAASRIVAAHEDGFATEVKLGTDKAKSIAARVIVQKPAGRAVRGISAHQLNRAIIQRNDRENKPTQKAIAIYKKMMSEE